jgi:hypothetical protein
MGGTDDWNGPRNLNFVRMRRFCATIILLIAVFAGFITPARGAVAGFTRSSLAAIGGARVASEVGLSAGEITRIQNAANAIGKPINLVGSRAGGTANAASDWDYIIDGLPNSNRNTIKNSLPGAPVRADQVPRTIDFLKPPLDTTLPYVPFTPKR